MHFTASVYKYEMQLLEFSVQALKKSVRFKFVKFLFAKNELADTKYCCPLAYDLIHNCCGFGVEVSE